MNHLLVLVIIITSLLNVEETFCVEETYCVEVLPVKLSDHNISEELTNSEEMSPNKCKENPDIYLRAADIIRRHGYPVETHTIQTDDGYLLSLHRIPCGRNGTRGGQPVFLQHGLLSSSVDWINANNNSLGFILADAGYDVWLGNFRGNLYSRAHISLPLDSAAFWNFSWHDMAVHDLPASIKYVSEITSKPGEILYIGHSMGTTTFFVFASRLPEVAKHIKAMVALAPVAFMKHIRSPIRYLSPFVDDLKWLMEFLGVNEFLPSNKILRYLSRDCDFLHVNKKICENVIFILCGFDEENFDDSLLPVILGHIPAGTSTKTVIHYTQEIKNQGDFRQYDYGKEGNYLEYGVPVPPSYKLDKIQVPIYLMYAPNDFLASPIDVLRLSNNLRNLIGMYEVPVKTFNHVDFLWAKNATSLVYEPMMKILKNYTTV